MIRPLLLFLALATGCGSTDDPASGPASIDTPRADDAAVARAVSGELDALIAMERVQSAVVVVIDPRDGRVVVEDAADASGHDGELARTRVRSHGSAAKPFAIAAALEAGAITLDERIEGGTVEVAGETIGDFAPHGSMSPSDVMAFSSNVGVTRIHLAAGLPPLATMLGSLGLGERVPAGADPLSAARLAYGPGLEATSVEIATAYAAIASGGVFHAPHRRGERASEGVRAMRAETAVATMSLLEDAVARDDGTGRRARIEGVRVAGKTGTAEHEGGIFGVFVGVVPAEAPRWVILVGVEAEGRDYAGGTLAAPAFARIAREIVE